MSDTPLTADQQCIHPPEQVQSGIYASGVYEHPVCMACGAELKSDAEVTFIQEFDNG